MRKPRLTAAEQCAADLEARLLARKQERRARIDEIIAEFGGEADPIVTMQKLAAEILYWRWRMKHVAEVVAMVESGEPFGLVGGGPHWKPEQRNEWWFR